MYAFWDTIIEPLLEIAGPRYLLEIGSDKGAATEKMLEYCERHGATLHAVDPAPRFDVDGLLERHAGRFIFHKDLSLNAIPGVPRFDAVFLDGDHNWHTVYNELTTIERCASRAGRAFPLVFVHDVDWPYGRRDLYYAPENIPADARHPHGGGGMVPGEPLLVPDAGLNAYSANANAEGGPRNGVLTAVEDYLATTALDIEMARVPCLYGLAILSLSSLREREPAFAEFLASLEVSPAMARYLARVEKERIGSEISRQECVRRRARVRGKTERLTKTNEKLEERNRALKQQVRELEQRAEGSPARSKGGPAGLAREKARAVLGRLAGPRAVIFGRDLRNRLEENEREVARLRDQVQRLRQRLPKRTVRPENIVWVFGSPRSGSTWFAKMLSSPERRRLWNEPFFGVVLALRGQIANDKHVPRRAYLLGDAAKDIWLPSMRNLFLDGAAARFPDCLLIAKEPNGSMSAPLIMEAFPESRLILLVRDPRDVVASQLDASKEGSWYGRSEYEAGALDGGGGTPAERLARQYALNVGAAAEAYDSHGGAKSLVRYEDLRRDARREMVRVDADLGLGTPADQLDLAVSAHDWGAVPAEDKGAGKFFRKASPGSWEEDLTPEQARAVESATATLLGRFYPA